MDGASKILTVSYGTFSCTLEGFDDPFSTMRSIAEYFRDLAAEDRYFGAEPPTPDAEMLHRIAQTQSKARVEAQIEDNSVVLRQSEAAPAALAGTEAGVAEAAVEPAPQATDTADMDESDSSATLGEAVYSEDELAATLAETDAGSESATVPPQSGDNSVAAKLSRIRAVVSGSDGAEDADTPFAGSIEEAFVDAEEAEWEDMSTDADSDDPSDDTDDDANLFDDGDAAADAPIDEIMQPLDAPGTFGDEPIAEDHTEDKAADAGNVEGPADDVADDDAPQLGLAARIVKLKRAAAEAPHGTDTDADKAAEVAEPEAVADGALSDDDEAELQRELSKLEEEDAVTEATAEDHWDDAPDAEASAEDDDAASDSAMRAAIARATSLTPDDADAGDDEPNRTSRAQNLAGHDNEEAALDRILEQTNSRMDDTEGSRRRSAIAHLKAAVAATKADRLLNRDRKSADDSEDQSQYRDDLAKVVQAPSAEEQASSFEEAETEAEPVLSEDLVSVDLEPEEDAASPLVLVSDQRVDPMAENEELDVSTPDATVIPRRVGDDEVAQVSEEEHEAGFADFAEKMGATDLPDLLEAAAAYTAFVEGNKAFSRPQLMRRVAHYETGEEFSREAGLRSFGQLLRQGKIQKLRRGQFTIGEDTRFNPEARIAGE